MATKQYIVFPDKMRLDMTIQSMEAKISQVFNGQSAWMVTAQGVQPFPESMVEEFERTFFRRITQLLTLFSSDEITVQYLGTKDVSRAGYLASLKGKITDVILASNTSGDSLKIFIDQETKYIVKKSYQAMTEQGLADTEEFVNDYRDVSGVKIGFHTVVYQNGEQSVELKLSEVKINAEVDDSLFEK